MVQFLDEVETSICRISTEAESGTNIDDILLEAEILLQDVTFLPDLFPAEDGDHFLQSVAPIYLWIENKKVIGK